ncbi:hypothetical protein GF068_08530 [Polyangium spumosum]|uniref:DUF676 domain-containing protein n=1 Tax=Polyangium spumosum TaxID=889282 RepID=A0A6N7PIY1_9BACT|nr:hypothetical protein [Polyangium spumosum]MRG91969.1 hypothetical protein [Polyangium spumosum]
MADRPSWARALVNASREALAFGRQAWLSRHDLEGAAAPAEVQDGDDVVVLLHGLFATAGGLRPMRRVITRHKGVHAAAMTYPPGPGVEELGERLAALTAELPGAARLHLVGHSLGGVVARFYAQEAGDTRVVQTISMASPFAGVVGASALGFGAARDLAPDSAVLRKIRLAASATANVPHLSIIARADAVLRSPVSHALPGGEVIVMEGQGHNTVLFDEEVARIVERRILGRRRKTC